MLKNSLAVKQKVWPFSKWPVWKKLWNLRGWPRNDCDGITTIQVNLCCLILTSPGIRTKLTRIVVIKNFVINLYHHSDFLANPFDLTAFFTLAILSMAALFFTARLFLSRYLWVILCQINKEFWITSQILPKLGVFVVPMVLTTHTNFWPYTSHSFWFMTKNTLNFYEKSVHSELQNLP